MSVCSFINITNSNNNSTTTDQKITNETDTMMNSNLTNSNNMNNNAVSNQVASSAIKNTVISLATPVISLTTSSNSSKLFFFKFIHGYFYCSFNFIFLL